MKLHTHAVNNESSTKLYFLIKPVKTKHAIFHTSVACNSIINQVEHDNVSSVVEFQRWLYVPKNQYFLGKNHRSE